MCQSIIGGKWKLTQKVKKIAIWEPILNPIWVPEALNRPQKGLNIELNCKFSKPFSLLGSFLTKNNGFLTRLENGRPIGRLFLGLERTRRALDENDQK